jgi:hypothetical protein
LLVAGVAALATRAKTSQYPETPGFSKHLSKATKMSNDRTQKSVAVYGAVRPLLEAPDLPAPAVFVIAALDVRPRSRSFLESFHFRPPPATF